MTDIVNENRHFLILNQVRCKSCINPASEKK